MKIVDRKTFLAMPEGTVYSKIQFRAPLPTEHAYAKNGWDSTFGIERPYIKGESTINDFFCAGLGSEYPKDGELFDVLDDICKNLGKEVPFEMAGGRDGCYDDTHIHFAIYSREEVQEMINELQESLRTAYSDK